MNLKAVEGGESGLIVSISPNFDWEDWVKPLYCSVRVGLI